MNLTFDIFGNDKTASKAIEEVGSKVEGLSKKADSVSKLTGSFDKLKGSAGAITGALVGGGLIATLQSTTSDFTDLVGQVTAVQRVSGGTIEDASRLRTEFQLSGVDAETGAKSMEKLSVNLATAAKSSTATAAMTKELGFAFTDAHGKVLPMNDLMPELADKFASMPNGAEKTALAVQLFGKAGVAMVPMLNKGSEGLKDMAKKSDEFGLTLNASAVPAMKAQKETSEENAAAMEGLKATIGQSLMPIITTLVTWIAQHVIPVIVSASKWIQDHAQVVKIAAIAIAGLVVALEGMKIISSIINTMKDFKAAMLAVNAAMDANPIAIIIGVIALLAAGFVYLWNHSAGFRDFWIGLWNAIKATTSAVIDWIVKAFHDVMGFLATIWGGIKAAAGVAWGIIKGVIINPVVAVVDWFHNSFGKVVGWFAGIWKDIVGGVKSGWSGVYAFIVKPLVDAWNWITGVFGKIGSWFGGLWNGIVGVVKDVWGAVYDWVIKPLSNALDWLHNVFYGIHEWFGGLFSGILGVVQNVWSWIYGYIVKPLQDAWNWITGVFNGLFGWFDQLWSDISNDLYDAWQNIAGWAEDAWNNVIGAVKDGINGVIWIINGLIDGVNWLAARISSIYNWIPGLTQDSIPAIPEISYLAMGGQMQPGQISIVGERGPELFRAGSAGGSVTSNALSRAAMSGSGSSGGTVHIHVNGVVAGTADQVARQLQDMLKGPRRRGTLIGAI